MNGYQPTLDDVQALLERSPQFFNSPLETARSIQNARQGLWTTQEATARAHYQQYLANGGAPFGPNGQMPPGGDALDQRFGSASCDCAAAAPCCMRALSVGCEHRPNRMTLPLADTTRPKVLVVVTDKGENPGHDTLTFTPTRRPGPTCSMPNGVPLLRITGLRRADPDLRMSGAQTFRATYSDNGEFGSTDLERLIFVVRKVLFGRTEDIHKYYDFEILSCSRTAVFNGQLQVYPKVEVKVSAFYYEVAGTFFSNLTFVPSMTMGGKIEGTYGGSTFSLEGKGTVETPPQDKTKSLIPFIDGAVSVLNARTGGGQGASGNTRSSIQIRHKVEIGNVSYKLAEHPSDHSKVGLEAEMQMAFAPLFGITAVIDLIDVALSAARGAAPVLADAIIAAREAMARGLGNPDGPVNLSAHVAITLEIEGNMGNGTVTARKLIGDAQWQSSGAVGGDIGLVVKGVVRAEGKIYRVSASAAGEAQAATKLKAELKTLTQAEQTAANGARFSAKVEWDGLTLSYSASARASIFGITTGTRRSSGSIVVCAPEVLYERNL